MRPWNSRLYLLLRVGYMLLSMLGLLSLQQLIPREVDMIE